MSFGGKWRLCDRDSKLIFYGYPVIYGLSPGAPEYEFCPLFEFQRFTVTKEKGHLREVLDVIFPPNLRLNMPPKG